MAQVTLHKNGKTKQISEEGSHYFIRNYGWSLDSPSAPSAPSVSTPTPSVSPTTPTTPATPVAPATTPQQPQTAQPSLIDITSQRPDVLAEAKKHGGDPYTAGTGANKWLNDWYNRTGKAEGADMASKGAFDKPAEATAVTVPATTKTTKSLVDIANSRPDVLEAAKAQGGDPFQQGTPANNWLNNWWNTAGKSEFPDVILGEPIDEQTQLTNKANEVMEEFFNNLPSGDDLEISDSQKILDEILTMFEEGAPEKPPSMAELFAETKASLGMEELETELADIDNQMDEINSELLIQAEEAGHGQQLVTTGQLNRRKGSLQREAENRIQRLNIQRGAVARMLNNKISSLNMIMQFSQQDYQNSAAYYKANFDRAIQMYNLVSKAEDKEMEIEEKAEQDAKANWTVIYNSIKDGFMSYGELTTDQKLQIKDLETQAGLPSGFMDMVMSRDPISEVQTVTSRTDSAGNTYFDVLKIGPDGTMTVDSIFKGVGKVSRSGGSGGSSGGFTSQEKRKLEQKGLLYADREKQLDFLYGDEKDLYPEKYPPWFEKQMMEATQMSKDWTEEWEAHKEKETEKTADDDEDPKELIKADVQQATGLDKKVNPNDIVRIRDEIRQNVPELLSWFDSTFKPEDYLDRDRYWEEIDAGVWTL